MVHLFFFHFFLEITTLLGEIHIQEHLLPRDPSQGGSNPVSSLEEREIPNSSISSLVPTEATLSQDLQEDSNLEEEDQVEVSAEAREKLFTSIKGIEGFRTNPKLAYYCLLTDGQKTWIRNSLLRKSKVGERWVKKGLMGRKKNLIKKICEGNFFFLFFFH